MESVLSIGTYDNVNKINTKEFIGLKKGECIKEMQSPVSMYYIQESILTYSDTNETIFVGRKLCLNLRFYFKKYSNLKQMLNTQNYLRFCKFGDRLCY